MGLGRPETEVTEKALAQDKALVSKVANSGRIHYSVKTAEGPILEAVFLTDKNAYARFDLFPEGLDKIVPASLGSKANNNAACPLSDGQAGEILKIVDEAMKAGIKLHAHGDTVTVPKTEIAQKIAEAAKACNVR